MKWGKNGGFTIGAPDANNLAGASYILFGDMTAKLTDNTLTIAKGETVVLTSDHLNATYNYHIERNPTLRFSISNIQHGFFAFTTAQAVPIISFSQQDILHHQVQFVHDGSQIAPAFSVKIDGLASMIPQWSDIISTLIPAPIVPMQFPQVVALSALTPNIGLLINAQDVSGVGQSVSSVGDINDDGIADFIMGSPYGGIYVVFGQKNLGASDISPTHLNGQNGFAILGACSSIGDAGDVNGDGVDDLIIGMPTAYNHVDESSYVVFGGKNIGNSGSLSLTSLNGTNGFLITTTPNDLAGGTSVNGAGDVNDDGVDDLIIGLLQVNNKAGASYVVFGGKNLGSAGHLSLANLTGTNGFVITGINPGDKSGNSVNRAGDVNADGIVDLIIGAPYANSNAGASYVVFGAKNIGSSGVLALSALNGTNGFAITGVHSNDYSGNSVSAAGDVNADGIADLMIGAPGANMSPGFSSGAGASYIVFGAHDIGSSGTLTLSSLNGLNGFSITGNPGEASGFSVSAAGDINADGIADLIIGAPYADAQFGKAYVIFGSNTIGFSGNFSLANINGANGFSIGGMIGRAGASVSGARDVNNDGIDDLIIGVPFGSNNAGAVAVLFGDATSFVLTNNELKIIKGHTLLLNSSNLNAARAVDLHNDPTIRFEFSKVQYGHFSLITNPSVVINTCSLHDIQNNQIQFIHDNSGFSPSFSTHIPGSDDLVFMPPQPAYIQFIHQGGKLISNTLTIDQGKTTMVLFTELNAVNLDNSKDNSQLIFLITNLQHGFFQFRYNPGVNITSFTQQYLEFSVVEFVHDNSIYPPSYTVSVNDGTSLSSNPESSNVTFYLTPVLVNNTLTIEQGKSVVLTSSALGAINPGINATELSYTTGNLQHGQFELWQAGDKTAITHFTQAQINNGLIAFQQDDSAMPPICPITLGNGRAGVGVPYLMNINFTLAPLPRLINNTLTIKQGETFILSNTQLGALDPEIKQQFFCKFY